VSESVSISAGIAARYATAVFSLAHDGKAIDTLEHELEALSDALAESADLRALIASPLYSRDDQARAMAALAGKMGLSALLKNTLALMAAKRRLFVLPQLVAELRRLIADARGEVTAEVRSARALTKAQSAKLAETLAKLAGKDVKIKATVDESLIGGLVVKLGSRMIDASIAAKLSRLQNAMKEVR